MHRRSKPFSNKQKKEQLKAKRERKRNKNDETSSSDESENKNEPALATTATTTTEDNIEVPTDKIKLINFQPTAKKTVERDPNRFNLQFVKESIEDLKKHKKDASKKLIYRDETELEIEIESVYKPSSPLDMPIRPTWTYEMTKEKLEQQERNYFQKYLAKIFEHYQHNELSYFEFNLETWRQLWRVLEISDIILLIVDIRFPSLHFSPVFYDYCTKKLKKDVILVLNKIDLVPTSVVIAWKCYFEKKYPNLHILLFSSSKQIKQRKNKPGDIIDQTMDDNQAALKALSAEIYTAQAHSQLYECVKNIVKSQVDLASWANLTELGLKNAISKTTATNTPITSDQNLILTNEDETEMDKLINSKTERTKFDRGYVTIGCCGFPNVGKSSLLNSLNGRKVVSVSRTPGHTKHLQTIFLTKNVRLVDCPGLVFPSLVEKPLQVLAGIYPIAQLQEPYRAIRYLSERVPVIDILKLKHPCSHEMKPHEQIDKEFVKQSWEWSPLDVCEGWALKRGYITAKASRPDVYRAANELLRMALDAKLCLSLKPKNYSNEKEFWLNHAETKALNDIVHSVEKAALENYNPNNQGEVEEDDEEIEDFENHNFEKKILSDNDEEEEYSSNNEDIQSSNQYSVFLKENDDDDEN